MRRDLMEMKEVVLWISERRLFWAEGRASAKALRQSRPDGGEEQEGGPWGWREVREG